MYQVSTGAFEGYYILKKRFLFFAGFHTQRQMQCLRLSEDALSQELAPVLEGEYFC